MSSEQKQLDTPVLQIFPSSHRKKALAHRHAATHLQDPLERVQVAALTLHDGAEDKTSDHLKGGREEHSHKSGINTPAITIKVSYQHTVLTTPH